MAGIGKIRGAGMKPLVAENGAVLCAADTQENPGKRPLQRGGFFLGGEEHGDVGVGVVPEGEEGLVGLFRAGFVAGHGVGAGEPELGFGEIADAGVGGEGSRLGLGGGAEILDGGGGIVERESGEPLSIGSGEEGVVAAGGLSIVDGLAGAAGSEIEEGIDEGNVDIVDERIFGILFGELLR
jgi:hypothetical protein